MNRFSLNAEQRRIYCRFADLPLPRHTSYPITPVWKSNYQAVNFRADLARSGQCRRPLSLYVHVPYCQRLCYYCACTKEIIPQPKRQAHDPAEDFLRGLALEIAQVAPLLARSPVYQVHLGGGSPTFLHPEQLQRLWTLLQGNFTIDPEAEIAIEIDPRITTRQHLEVLRGLGFNRISLGIQDFDPEVQRVVNRTQPFDLVADVVRQCRELGFVSLNFDLIYGLPFQTRATMEETLRQTLALGPDRIAFYRLAVIPDIFRWQNVFRQEDLPGGEESLDLNLQAINFFLDSGYEFIGLDHFAKPGEALTQSRQENSLQRTFQGMTTGKGLDLVGLGPSSISLLADAYAQNVKTSADWLDRVQSGLATERGLALSSDDRIRRELMQQLYGHGSIHKAALWAEFGITFNQYFADELERLQDLEKEGLVSCQRDSIQLTTPLGRLLVRVVAAVFDHYLPRNAYLEGLPAHLASKVG